MAITPDDALKWGASFVMSGGGLLAIYQFAKNAVELRRTIIDTRRAAIEIELKRLELNEKSAVVKPVSLEEMDRVIKARATVSYSVQSRALAVAVGAFLVGAVVWASVDAHQSSERLRKSNADLNQAIDRLKRAEEELRQLKTSLNSTGPKAPPKPTQQAPPPKPAPNFMAHLELKTIGHGNGPATLRVINSFSFPVTISIDGEADFEVPGRRTVERVVKTGGPTKKLSLVGGGRHLRSPISFTPGDGNVLELTFQREKTN
jgi:hypothetical protein